MENFDETHTAIVDDYEERAEAVDIMTNHPYPSCYNRLIEHRELLGRARVHQEEARKIRKIFKELT